MATERDPLFDVVALRPFVPASDFETSLRFYTDLGFDPVRLGDGLASLQLGPFGFLLQGFYAAEWGENFMMHLLVRHLDAWWRRIDGLDLSTRYKVKAPAAPKLQSWGLVASHLWDPCGVLWHVVQEPDSIEPQPSNAPA